MLFALLPVAGVALAVWVKQRPKPVALIILELAIVDLPIWPKILSEPLLLIALPVAFVDSAVGPDEEPKAVHGVVCEFALVNLSATRNGSAVSRTEAILEPALIDGLALEYFEALAIGAPVCDQGFAAVDGTTPPLLKQILIVPRLLYPLHFLRFLIVVEERREVVVVVFLEIERPQFLINCPYIFISQLIYDIVEILKAELGVELVEILHHLRLKATLKHILVLHLAHWSFLGDEVVLG